MSDEWVKQVEEALKKSNQWPSVEEEISFPWEQASTALADALKLKVFEVTAADVKVTDLLSGMGNSPNIVGVELSPISGSALWAISSEDLSALTAYALSPEHKSDGFSEAKLQEGFYYFLLLEAMHALDALKVFKDASLRLLPQGKLPQESCKSLDISISIPEKTLHARLLLPHSFLQAFQEYRPAEERSLLMTKKAKLCHVTVRFESGTVSLSEDEWKNLTVGDFIALDHTAYDPETKKGSVSLLIGETALLRGRVKPEGVKISDGMMQYEPSEAIEPLEEESIAVEEEEHLWAPSEEVISHPQEGAFVLAVEAGRISMTIEKLLSLKPDEMIEMPLHPEQEVSLISNGKTVAMGELIKLGKTVGVRITANG